MKSFIYSVPKTWYPWFAGIGLGVIIGSGLMSGILWWREPEQKLERVSKVLAVLSPLHPSRVSTVGGDVTSAPPATLRPPELPKIKSAPTAPPTLTAQSVIVKDESSGAVLYRKNEYERRPIASLSKLVSALVLLDTHMEWNNTLSATTNAVADSRLLPGAKYTVDQLWQTALVGSSNQAIVTFWAAP
jgi:hypothetical protein